jgi:hypothetical protein
VVRGVYSVIEGKRVAVTGARAVVPGALAFVARASVELLSLRLRKSTLAVGRSAYAPTDDLRRPERH